jgi:hypothetical protein
MPAAAGAKLPPTFFGTMANGALDDPAVLDAEGALMARDGLGTIRLPVEWAMLQPEAGAPPDLTSLDARIAAAARHRLDVLPIVLRTPPWAATDPLHAASAPRRVDDYTAFLRVLIARYGGQGSFWAERPDLPRMPIRAWQIYNEPNLENNWSAQPFARPYTRVLCGAYKAIHAADPAAKVVMAGLPNDSWRALERLERAGVHGCFDVAAVHPYSGRPENSLKITRLNRRVLDRHGDRRKPLWITELTWPSALGKTKNIRGWETTAAGQAKRLRAGYRLYIRNARRLRLQRIYWYTWATRDGGSPSSFEWSGLRRVGADGQITDKPAMRALRDVIRRQG